MVTMEKIEKLTKAYADAREDLTAVVQDLEAETAKLRRRRLPAIRRLVDLAANGRAELEAAIEESTALFKKPKTRILHGVRVGFMKGKGELQWADAATVVKLIRKHLPDQAETLVKVSAAPVKAALQALDVGTLKKLGVTVADTGDKVMIKPAAGDIDKLVEALLKAVEDDETEAES